MKILGIVGSPRNKGNTHTIINWVLEKAKKEGAATQALCLTDLNIKHCTGCTKCFIDGECPLKDDVDMVHNKMRESDGIVFGAPAYAMNVPAQTKVFIDRSSFMAHRPEFIGKFSLVVSPAGAGIGSSMVVNYLERILYTMGYSCLGKITAVAYGQGNFSQENKVIGEAEALAVNLINAIRNEEVTHTAAKSYVPAKEVRQAIVAMGPYLKADYEFWRSKGWIG